MAANPVMVRIGLAAVAVAVVAACSVASSSPGAPTESDPSAALLLAEYRAARDGICRLAADASPVPNEDLLAVDVLYDPTMSAEDRAASIEAVRALAGRFEATVDRLEGIDAPAQVSVEHIASVTRARDVVALLGRLAGYLGTGELTAARALDEAIGIINVKIEAFEAKYGLSPCP